MNKRSVIVIGNFDGVHIAHQKLIVAGKNEAKKNKASLIALTFDPHPVAVLAPKLTPPLLQSLDERLSMLKEFGVEQCVVEKFSHEVAEMSAREFFEKIIKNNQNALSLIAGYDFTMGKNREGNSSALKGLGDEFGVNVIIIEPQFIDHTLISSTNIRMAIHDGDVDIAKRLLGRPYEIKGVVVEGHGIAKDLGARTANILTHAQIIPADGIYLTWTTINKSNYPSISSIGHNPTFPNKPHTIETHIIDKEVDLLGKQISILFIQRMREQKNFGTAENLARQINLDIKEAKILHEKMASSFI